MKNKMTIEAEIIFNPGIRPVTTKDDGIICDSLERSQMIAAINAAIYKYTNLSLTEIVGSVRVELHEK